MGGGAKNNPYLSVSYTGAVYSIEFPMGSYLGSKFSGPKWKYINLQK